MAMSHANCTHPRTPAGRAACRKLGVHLATVAAPATATPVAEIKMTGPVARRMARTAAKVDAARTTPKVSDKSIKKTGSAITKLGDLADMPRGLGHGVRAAWAEKWPVKVGPVFTETERIVIITGPTGELWLTWADADHTKTAVSVRPHGMPVWSKVDTIHEGLEKIK